MPGEAPLLTASEQDEYLRLFAVGASPQMACTIMGCSITSFLRTAAENEPFLERIQQAGVALSQNVAAKLYRTAMDGNVTAQKSYLQLRPPPEWKQEAQDRDAREPLTPHELAAKYLAAGLDVPPELQALLGCADRALDA